MNKFFLVALIFIFSTLSIAAQSEQIKWQTDYQQASAMARETGKPLMIDFWAKWCQPCRLMDETFWTRADVIEAVKTFIPLKINYDEQPNIAKQYSVRGLPYVGFTDPFGNLFTFRRGFGTFTAEDIKQIVGAMPKDFKTLNKAFDAIAAKKDDAAALLEIADYYSKNQMPFAANKYYQIAFYTPEIQKNPAHKEQIASKYGQEIYKTGNQIQTIAAAQDYLRNFPKGADRETFYLIMVNSYAAFDQLTEAENALQRLKKEFPNSEKNKQAEQEIEKAKARKNQSSFR